MNRKDFLIQTSLSWSAIALLPLSSIVQSCDYTAKIRQEITASDAPLLNVIGGQIIPKTAHLPGADELDIGAFMVMMVQDCYIEEEKRIFVNGLNRLDATCQETFNNSFDQLKPVAKAQLLTELQEEAILYNKVNEDVTPLLPHFFDQLKGLTIEGYFTSEMGSTVAREYHPLPGRYDGCIPVS